ncbi:10360_t:CDS:2 [Funneliformis geosporum]|uniref:10360_t:CDS:1 n=1 Tax=Funneliformis geosporum TaxID=1117311 RepID=A0A9W4WVM7_9GLOM|nr:10360_t:CDS:2 [Funneliformis geosporum]
MFILTLIFFLECWESDPDNRPAMNQVVDRLKAIMRTEDNSSRVEPSHFYPSSMEKSDNILSSTKRSYISKKNDKDLNVFSAPMDYRADLNSIVAGLIALLIKAINEGKSREQLPSILQNYLSSHNFTIEKVYKWLYENNMNSLDYIFFMGYLNFSGFGTNLNFNEAFNYFLQASSGKHPISRYFLGICYEFGYGTTIDKRSAVSMYEECVKIGQYTVSKFALGVCYENGIGIKKDEGIASFYYIDAANNGHSIAQYRIGNFYSLGIHVEKNPDLAFYYYSLSAKGDYSFGINMLGYCYLKGIGTSIDKKKSFDLFLKAANLDCNIAQYNIAVCFDDGIGTIKNFDKALLWYTKSADNGCDKANKRLENISEDLIFEYGKKKAAVDTDTGKKEDSVTEHKIIQQWKLNHGLFCDGTSIQPSKMAVLVDDGDLSINLYKGEPIVFVNINDSYLPTSPLTLENHNVEVYSDVCINFPVVEITYRADRLESFSKLTDDESYGHFIAKTFLAGGQLLIKNFDLGTPTQRDILKFYISWAYNMARNNNETPFNKNSFDFSNLPRLETSKGVILNTLQKLSNWLRKLYLYNIINIISYVDLVSIKDEIATSDKHLGIVNFKEKFCLDKWVGITAYGKLARWIKDFRLFQGLAINKSNEIESSKKFAIKFTDVPKVNLRDESYFELINPTTKLEEILISNNIFSIKNIRNFPFNKHDDFIDKEYIRLIVKYEKYEISIRRDQIKPSEEFNDAIEKALKNMKPFNALQDVFNEYGHLFPLKIILGKTLKYISSTNCFGTFERINLKLPINSLQTYLNNLKITCLTTHKGDVIEDYDQFQNANNDLEIVEYDEIISLYDVLDAEQKKNIDFIYDNNLKIIMTGINDLKDLDINNIEHYKRINIETSLEDEDYEVFGSIITKDNFKSEDFFARFRLLDVNGFSAMIKPLRKSEVDIRTCHILWMIVGNPLKLSVCSPNYREIKVDCIERSIELNVNDSNYTIKALPLSRGDTILIDTYYPSTNYEPHSIFKLVEWENEAINFQLIKSTYNESSLDSFEVQPDENNDSLTNIKNSVNIDIHVIILHSDYVSLMIDNHEKKYDLDLFGYILTNENLNKKCHELDKFDSIQSIIKSSFINVDVESDIEDLSQSRGDVRKFPSEVIKTNDNDRELTKPMSKSKPLIRKVIAPFASFLPLITDVARVFNEIIELYHSAEHNQKICGILLDRVQVADTSVRNLKNRRAENVEFFSVTNLYNLQKLVNVIDKIRKLVEEISQIKRLSKYIHAQSIEKRVKELINEFDSTIQLLPFSLTVDFSKRADNVNQDIKSDIEDLSQYLENIGSGITDNNQNVSDMVVQINALNNTVNNMVHQSDVFQKGEPSDDKNVRKFKRRKHGMNVFVALKLVADKNSKEEDISSLKSQVTILKKLKECNYIIQFHGLTSYADKFYLVTEWAEFGNLREYYQKYGPLEVQLKLTFALDISRGLNFLSAVSIVHRDIRAENILITDHQTAKIANFKSSRTVFDRTQNQKATLEAIRYCAPEKLSNGKYKYDTKCEVYSFGILLWEIAEERIPYERFGEDIIAIQEQVCIKNYREPFSHSSLLPIEYQELSINAVHHDHKFRPQFSKIFTMLQDLKNKGCRSPPVPKHLDTSDSLKLSDDEVKEIMSIPNFADFDYMTVDEAAKQHKLPDGNRESAYKCFEAYADLGDVKAKYMKAYYIQQKLVRLDIDQADKDKLVAELYKEAADSGDEFPEALLRYGSCLYRGVGVQRDLKESALYFTKAAENGQAVGMYNAASLYISGGSGKLDKDLGEKYMRLAAYKQNKQAIDYCKKHGLPL